MNTTIDALIRLRELARAASSDTLHGDVELLTHQLHERETLIRENQSLKRRYNELGATYISAVYDSLDNENRVAAYRKQVIHLENVISQAKKTSNDAVIKHLNRELAELKRGLSRTQKNEERLLEENSQLIAYEKEYKAEINRLQEAIVVDAVNTFMKEYPKL